MAAVVEPERVTFMLGPPPPDDFLETLAEMSPEDAADLLVSEPAEVEAIAWRATVRADFIETARELGYQIFPEATSGDLTTAPPSPGGALFLVAHQDARGVHMFDGAIHPSEVHALMQRKRGSEPPYTTVDLAVCRANRPGNLAATFQALGATVVLTRGEVGYDGGMFRRLLHLLEVLSHESRLSLPEIHDLAWLRESDELPRAGGPA